MIKLEGIVLNVFTQQGGQNKKRRNIRRPRQVQILGAMELPNGGVKNELFTLSVENYRDFKDYLNQKFPLQSVQWPVTETLFLCRKRCFTGTRDKFLILDKKQ